ncbi:FAD/NAD(P)-binding oxidoreductase family protein, partial [Tanacetum coccineum]
TKKLKLHKSILIVGGGPTGVELVGEISKDCPNKKITLVHKRYGLLEFLRVKAFKNTLDWLQSKHVEVKLEQTINLEDVADGSKPYKTSVGETIKADWVFLCLGKPLASSWLKNTILRDSLDAIKSMIVDENLRVKGRKNIFAIEDIRNIKVSFYAL